MHILSIFDWMALKPSPIVDGDLLAGSDCPGGGDAANHSEPRMTENVRLAVGGEAVTHLESFLDQDLRYLALSRPTLCPSVAE